ncbi:MAG TPA: M56 family metallopeptidase [Gemmatimonadaceae bacterium]|nr:M56 family metallopeptidase [Gemmatimonadaceae bacterium]
MNPIARIVLGVAPIVLTTKTTAVLALATGVALALRHASAAWRHLVWLGALVSCLALVLLSPIMPATVLTIPAAGALRIADNVRASPVLDAASAQSVHSVASPGPADRLTQIAESVRRHGTLLLAIWIVGCLVILTRGVLGHVVLARLVRQSRLVTWGGWSDTVRAASYDAGVRREVKVLCCPTLSAPVASGIFHPIILVPETADTWSDERRRSVLIHEFAHIARGDSVAQLIAVVATALLWFHPLAWLANVRLRAEAERAADDVVLANGMTSVRFASILLELARAANSPRLRAVTVIGMLRSSSLEERFRAMLDSGRSRTRVSRRLRIATTMTSVAVMIPLASLRTADAPHPRTIGAPARDTTLAGVGYSARKQSGLGVFVDGGQINHRLIAFSEVMRVVPGFRIAPAGNGRSYVISDARKPSGCVNFYVDGVLWQTMTPGDIDEFVRPDQLVAIEAYDESSTPRQFISSGQQSCATIVVWTRARVRPD